MVLSALMTGKAFFKKKKILVKTSSEAPAVTPKVNGAHLSLSVHSEFLFKKACLRWLIGKKRLKQGNITAYVMWLKVISFPSTT